MLDWGTGKEERFSEKVCTASAGVHYWGCLRFLTMKANFGHTLRSSLEGRLYALLTAEASTPVGLVTDITLGDGVLGTTLRIGLLKAVLTSKLDIAEFTRSCRTWRTYALRPKWARP